MISNVNDISYFLEAIERFRSKSGIRKKILYPFVKIRPSLFVYPFDYDEVFEFGLNLNLYKEKDSKVMLTDRGLSIIDMKDTGLDLTAEQKKYIVENCLFENKKFENITRLLKNFVFHKKKESFVIINEKTKKYENEISILAQFGVITNKDGFWVMGSDYLDYVEQTRQGISKPMTPKQLEAILAEQKRIGDLAEELTLVYEKKRLKKQKLNFESKNVNKVEYVNKGYDIESFSKKAKEPNLFIEVKGRKWDLSSFIISINEIKTAKRLGNKYAIYFWNNLSSKVAPKKPLKIIRDPFKKLSFDQCKNCLNYLVEITD